MIADPNGPHGVNKRPRWRRGRDAFWDLSHIDASPIRFFHGPQVERLPGPPGRKPRKGRTKNRRPASGRSVTRLGVDGGLHAEGPSPSLPARAPAWTMQGIHASAVATGFRARARPRIQGQKLLLLFTSSIPGGGERDGRTGVGHPRAATHPRLISAAKALVVRIVNELASARRWSDEGARPVRTKRTAESSGGDAERFSRRSGPNSLLHPERGTARKVKTPLYFLVTSAGRRVAAEAGYRVWGPAHGREMREALGMAFSTALPAADGIQRTLLTPMG